MELKYQVVWGHPKVVPCFDVTCWVSLLVSGWKNLQSWIAYMVYL